MIHFLCGLCLGSVVAFFIFCLFYVRRGRL